MTKKTAIFGITAVGALDAVFKFLAIKNLPDDSNPASFPIDFLLHKNPGIAFNIPIPLPIVIVLSIAVIAFITRHGVLSWEHQRKQAVASAMIVVGALGNMIDRIVNDFTTDYIILLTRSAINLSDILILVGTILLFLYSRSNSRGQIE